MDSVAISTARRLSLRRKIGHRHMGQKSSAAACPSKRRHRLSPIHGRAGRRPLGIRRHLISGSRRHPFFAGTYVRHPLAMRRLPRHAPGYLKEQGPGLQQRLNERTTQFVTRLNTFFREQGAPLQLEHFSSLFYPHFEPEVKIRELVLLPSPRARTAHLGRPPVLPLSTAHTDADVEEVIRIFQGVRARNAARRFLRIRPAGEARERSSAHARTPRRNQRAP